MKTKRVNSVSCRCEHSRRDSRRHNAATVGRCLFYDTIITLFTMSNIGSCALCFMNIKWTHNAATLKFSFSTYLLQTEIKL